MGYLVWDAADAAVVVLGYLGVKMIWHLESGVHFRFGRFVGTRSPGLSLIIPVKDRLVKVGSRVITMFVEPQEGDHPRQRHHLRASVAPRRAGYSH